TSKWHYYITKRDWNPNKPLTRADLEPIGTVAHNGTAASTNLTHTINVPTDRNGYHVILA
ncbi:lytic polysaccharide monooxygenase, partial [Lysinibacillus sphaericus]